MKTFRKITSFLLAFMMMFGAVIHLSAAEEETVVEPKSPYITVENTIPGHTYTLYKIFDLAENGYEGSGNTGHFAYTVNSAFEGFLNDAALNSDGKGGKLISVDENGYVEMEDGFDSQTFAQNILKYAEAHTDTVHPAKDPVVAAAEQNSITWDNLELGAYIVGSTAGAYVTLTTTKPNANVIEKNANNTVDKDVLEGDSWGDENDASIGDVVNFKATITITGVTHSLIFHDTMSDGLDFLGVTAITVHKGNSTDTIKRLNDDGTENDDFKKLFTIYDKDSKNADESPVIKDGCTFEIVFNDVNHKGGQDLDNHENDYDLNDYFVIEYEAKLNSNAVVTSPETNKAKIEYTDRNDDNKKSPETETKTYTYKFGVFKKDEDGNGLSGAQFKLYKEYNTETNTLTEVIKFEKTETGSSVKYSPNASGTEILESPAGGKFSVEGLDDGTYYLYEEKAPTGYNKLKYPIKVVINRNIGSDPHSWTVKYATWNSKTNQWNDLQNANGDELNVDVINKTGPELPETGGIGTTMFYTVGGALVLGAAVLLITKKRAKAE